MSSASAIPDRCQRGVFAFMTAPTVTTITNAGDFQPIDGAFTNPVLKCFSVLPTPAIRYDGIPTRFFVISWFATFCANTGGTTVSMAVKNGAGMIAGSEMTAYCKTASEDYTLGGTCVKELATGDTIQLIITSDGTGDQITVERFTTTIKEFF